MKIHDFILLAGALAIAACAPDQGRTRTASAETTRPVVGEPGLEQGSIELPTGIRMSYRARGNPGGQPVILLHGYSDSGYSWSRVLPLLPDEFRVFAPDLRGHGTTSRANDYSMTAMAGDVLAFMDALDVERATIVGHSMGGLVAQQVAATSPDRVSALVLVATATTLLSYPGIKELEAAVMGLTDPVDPEFIREFQESTVFHPVPVGFMDSAIGESARLSAETWQGVFRGMAGTPPARIPRGIPTLIFWGNRDPFFPAAEQQILQEMIPGSLFKTYPETGHAVHWERPAEFAGDVVMFLRTVSR
ncbi:MAG: alpha/beta fold hydrolase [Gemmatimonadales bacterium]